MRGKGSEKQRWIERESEDRKRDKGRGRGRKVRRIRRE